MRADRRCSLPSRAFWGAIESDKDRLTRLDLADWLTDPHKGKGKLHARVLANRLWYLFFGRGLAPDLTDFGGQRHAPRTPRTVGQPGDA